MNVVSAARCRGSGACLNPAYLCDRVAQCPLKDDELYCGVRCPAGCRCQGHAAACTATPAPARHPHLRYLDLSGAANVSLDGLHLMELLFFLNASACGLASAALAHMPRLHTLDLSSNRLAGIGALGLQDLPQLRHLDLSRNPLSHALDSSFTSVLKLSGATNLHTLLMNNVGVETVDNGVFEPLGNLQRLELNKNPLRTYGKDVLSGLASLQQLWSDDYKLCCSYFHEDAVSLTPSNCHAPSDELSSCDDLLAQDLFRAALWVFACLAVLGNLGVLAYRQFLGTEKASTPSALLVKNLCVSDLLMGVYLLMIGAADERFKGEYVSQEAGWRASVTCTVAGFLSFLSSEVSAFTVCLITLDRVLAICLPFRKHLHLQARSARTLCLAVWVAGAALASVPLLAGTESYGQNGICVPLPITRTGGPELDYTFCVFILLNFVLFVFVGVGQATIWAAVRRTSAAAGSRNQERDMALARRLFLVVLTDFLCWFPIGLLGVLAAAGVPVPGVVHVWSAVFVLPLNSAINPFLYTLNSVREKRRAARGGRRREVTLARLAQEVGRWPADSVRHLARLGLGRLAHDADKLTAESVRQLTRLMAAVVGKAGEAKSTAKAGSITQAGQGE